MAIRGCHCLTVLEPEELDQIGRLLPVPSCLAGVPAVGVGQVCMQLFEVKGNRGILVYSPPVAALIDAKRPPGFVSVDPQRAANRRVQLFGLRDDVCYY